MDFRSTYGIAEVLISSFIFYIPVILINLLRLGNAHTLTIIYTWGMFIIFLYIIATQKYGSTDVKGNGVLKMPK